MKEELPASSVARGPLGRDSEAGEACSASPCDPGLDAALTREGRLGGAGASMGVDWDLSCLLFPVLYFPSIIPLFSSGKPH